MNITQTVFDGLAGYELTAGSWKMVVITECGPRIAFLGRAENGNNLLYWNQNEVQRGEWHLRGGHRVWITRPYADESEDTYLADNEPCQVELEEQGLTVTAPPHPFSRLERGMRIRILDDNHFEVTNFIRNGGDLIYSGGVWSPTCIRPDGSIIRIPLGEEDSTWDLIKIVIPRKFAGNTGRVNDPQVSLSEDEMTITPHGILTKRCVCAPKGWISAEWPEESVRFTKHTQYIRDGRYQMDGCNLAAFVGADNWMAEIETYGIERSLRPGETMEHTEIWGLSSFGDGRVH